MSQRPPQAEYLVISRGQWDRTLSRDEIQNAIDRFYIWLDRMVDEGKMKLGQRLTYEGRKVVRQNVVTDGPFGESKEVIGGYWLILATNLDEAVQIAKGNPAWTAVSSWKSGPSTRNVQLPTIPASHDSCAWTLGQQSDACA